MPGDSMDEWPVQSHRACSRLMLSCCHLGILTKFWTRGSAFSFCVESSQLCSRSCLVSQDMSLRDSDPARSERCQDLRSPERAWGWANILLTDPRAWVRTEGVPQSPQSSAGTQGAAHHLAEGSILVEANEVGPGTQPQMPRRYGMPSGY